MTTERRPDITEVSSREALDRELRRERHTRQTRGAIGRTARMVAAVAGIAAIVATFMLPVMRVDGSSMSETLSDGDIVVAARAGGCSTGDVIAFYHNNDILIKRVIATGGQWVDIDERGVVRVDGQVLDEPYVTGLARGDVSIGLPYQVPDGRLFVMGDHRETSVDSRSTQVGPVREELVVGRIFARVWPPISMKLF